jgi:hypothetical protein
MSYYTGGNLTLIMLDSSFTNFGDEDFEVNQPILKYFHYSGIHPFQHIVN